MTTELETTAPRATAVVSMGFNDLASFEFMQRTAKMFSVSSMVPPAYQAMVTKGYGDKQTVEANPAALSNCVIALDMSQRMNANPLMIMQNLHIIEGRPSWSSQFIIAAINNCGKFSPLRFDLQWLDEMDATFSTFVWENRQKIEKKTTVRIKNARCVAWAIEKATGERLESAPVTMEMAVSEGWFGKNGSKWKSMPDLMMRYRSAAFFGRIYAPELLMGLPASDEVREIVDVEPQADGSYSMPAPADKPAAPLRKSASKHADVTDADPKTATGADPESVAAKADPATSELQANDVITAAQAKWINSKLASIDLSEEGVLTLLTRFGATSVETMTPDQFDAIRAELLSVGA